MNLFQFVLVTKYLLVINLFIVEIILILIVSCGICIYFASGQRRRTTLNSKGCFLLYRDPKWISKESVKCPFKEAFNPANWESISPYKRNILTKRQKLFYCGSRLQTAYKSMHFPLVWSKIIRNQNLPHDVKLNWKFLLT